MMKNMLAIISGIFVSFISIGTIIKILFIYKVFALEFKADNVKEELNKIEWIIKIFVLPCTSLFTSFAVGLISATKPWLCGMIAIVPVGAIVLVISSFSPKEVIYFCLLLFISGTLSSKVYLLKNKKKKE